MSSIYIYTNFFVLENLEDLPADTEEYEEFQSILEQSYLDSDFLSKWKPARIQKVQNKTLASEYEGELACTNITDIYIRVSYSIGSPIQPEICGHRSFPLMSILPWRQTLTHTVVPVF